MLWPQEWILSNTSLSKHIYLQCFRVSLLIWLFGSKRWPMCLDLFWCTLSKQAISTGDREGEKCGYLCWSLLLLYCFLCERQQKQNSADLWYWLALCKNKFNMNNKKKRTKFSDLNLGVFVGTHKPQLSVKNKSEFKNLFISVLKITSSLTISSQ